MKIDELNKFTIPDIVYLRMAEILREKEKNPIVGTNFSLSKDYNLQHDYVCMYDLERVIDYLINSGFCSYSIKKIMDAPLLLQYVKD